MSCWWNGRATTARTDGARRSAPSTSSTISIPTRRSRAASRSRSRMQRLLQLPRRFAPLTRSAGCRAWPGARCSRLSSGRRCGRATIGLRWPTTRATVRRAPSCQAAQAEVSEIALAAATPPPSAGGIRRTHGRRFLASSTVAAVAQARASVAATRVSAAVAVAVAAAAAATTSTCAARRASRAGCRAAAAARRRVGRRPQPARAPFLPRP